MKISSSKAFFADCFEFTFCYNNCKKTNKYLKEVVTTFSDKITISDDNKYGEMNCINLKISSVIQDKFLA
jgi:hypothetical protein